MTKLTDELSVVPLPARLIAAVIYLAGVAGFIALNRHSAVPVAPFPWPVLIALVVAIIPAIYALLVGYVYGDARRRGMRQGLWTLLAALIPNAIGIILYFLLREPLQRVCPACGAQGKGAFAFCPACGAAYARSCPDCRRAVEPEWTACAWCGKKLKNSTEGPA